MINSLFINLLINHKIICYCFDNQLIVKVILKAELERAIKCEYLLPFLSYIQIEYSKVLGLRTALQTKTANSLNKSFISFSFSLFKKLEL